MESLSDDLVLEVMGYLNPVEILARFPRISSRYRQLSNYESLWRQLYSRSVKPEIFQKLKDSNPKPGQYQGILTKVHKQVEEARSNLRYLREYQIETFGSSTISYSPGISVEDEYHQLDRENPLPLDVKLLYGQINGDMNQKSATLGGITFYDFKLRYNFCPFTPRVLKLSTGQMKPILIFAVCHNTRSRLFIDLADVTGEGIGTVFSFMGSTSYAFVWSQSAITFINAFVEKIKSRKIGRRHQKNYIDLFDTSLGGVCVTEGVRIEAIPCFVPEVSEPTPTSARYFYTYQIRISCDCPEGEKVGFKKVRLATRTWSITGANGLTETISGEGVIGLYPEIYPDCELFVYESCTHFTTPSGKMTGHFTFEREDGSTFDAIVPEMKFSLPEGTKIVDMSDRL
mmetsp:Transcript_43637/g.50197  ORF Transcript_43637/g.50197 Transcript_43637/m.50197 type:complete len:400 (-) Transcript_43637:371-1570(-)|eukprot:CAMPEP_0115045836 /NCGR_PEP_ID=MMETSP0216-20121206/48408_1 /TAXON_ID=223996 /ORGANISM="Protocruzia adherens, Strain Boccale" /LENGTH=399 /DNA_ID=CAMNT_0002428837 /DNA_START=45 /DNA_END=1244 /DNA_ORIENTATION=+